MYQAIALTWQLSLKSLSQLLAKHLVRQSIVWSQFRLGKPLFSVQIIMFIAISMFFITQTRKKVEMSYLVAC